MPAINDEIDIMTDIRTNDNSFITKKEALEKCRACLFEIFGTNGIEPAQENLSGQVDKSVSDWIKLWTDNADTKSTALWFDYPFTSENDEKNFDAEIAAYHALFTVKNEKFPFIFSTCRTSENSELPEGHTSKTAGLLSLVNSLISQLLSYLPYQIQDDGETGNSPSEKISSWPEALKLLFDLLEDTTTTLRHCIIHGLNGLESDDDGAEQCAELLNVLFTQLVRATSPCSLLFTTSGHSRALTEIFEKCPYSIHRIPSELKSPHIADLYQWSPGPVMEVTKYPGYKYN